MTRFRSRRRAIVAGLAGIGSLCLVTVPAAAQAGAAANLSVAPWVIEPSPNPAGVIASQLDAVSCPAPGRCVAVGSAYPSSVVQHALIEQLSAGKWTIMSDPAVAKATDSPLAGVSCPAAGFCAAVGYARYQPPQVTWQALAETWNGSSWKQEPLPLPVNASSPSLAAVSCPAAGNCIAVGDYVDTKTGQYRPLAERFDGSAWSVLSAPNPYGASGNSQFTGIACPTSTSCEAVGNVAYNDTLEKVIAYGLSGSTWTRQRPVNPGQDPANIDSSVSCSTISACMTVGELAAFVPAALAESWNGSTWVRQRTPAPVGRPVNALSGVSCAGGASCVAVGVSSSTQQTANQTMAEVWNGTSWSQSPSVNMPGRTTGLFAVSCTAATACVAVGSSAANGSGKTLIEAYSG
jgi:hypothetical protein